MASLHVQLSSEFYVFFNIQSTQKSIFWSPGRKGGFKERQYTWSIAIVLLFKRATLPIIFLKHIPDDTKDRYLTGGWRSGHVKSHYTNWAIVAEYRSNPFMQSAKQFTLWNIVVCKESHSLFYRLNRGCSGFLSAVCYWEYFLLLYRISSDPMSTNLIYYDKGEI